jgi:uncharacterized ubiquitin-like protein YukD
LDNRAVVTLNLAQRNEIHDLDIPLDINASELLEALNSAFGLGINVDDSAACFVKTENPIALLHGRKTLREYGLMNGSIINITE